MTNYAMVLYTSEKSYGRHQSTGKYFFDIQATLIAYTPRRGYPIAQEHSLPIGKDWDYVERNLENADRWLNHHGFEIPEDLEAVSEVSDERFPY